MIKKESFLVINKKLSIFKGSAIGKFKRPWNLRRISNHFATICRIRIFGKCLIPTLTDFWIQISNFYSSDFYQISRVSNCLFKTGNQGTEQSVVQAIESLSDQQVTDFMTHHKNFLSLMSPYFIFACKIVFDLPINCIF